MGLLHALTNPAERKAWAGEIPVDSLYTAGVAGEKFLGALRDRGVILASRCDKCGTTTLLPRAFCERCLSPTDSYPEVEAKGKVATYTVLRRDLDNNRIDRPEVLAFVSFDGVEGGIIHWLREVAADKVEVGMPVEAVLRPKGDREGSILDISHFRPVSFASGE